MSKTVPAEQAMTRDQLRRVRALVKGQTHDGFRVRAGFKDGHAEVSFPPNPHRHRVDLNRRKAPRTFRAVMLAVVVGLVALHLAGRLPLTATTPHAVSGGLLAGAVLGLWDGWPRTRRARFSVVGLLVALAVLVGVEELRELHHFEDRGQGR